LLGHVACFGEIRNAYKILVGKPEEKRSFERSRHGLDDDLTNLRELGWEGVVWIHLGKDRDQ